MSGEIEFELEVGLEYDLSPIIGNKLISQILAAGGTFYIDGNIIVIESLPEKEEAPPAAVEAPAPAPEPEPEEEVVRAPVPVVEEEEVEAPVVESEEVKPVPAAASSSFPAPKPRARKTTSDTVED